MAFWITRPWATHAIKVTILVLSSTLVLAEEKQDQKNVYDDFRQSQKGTGDSSVDEQVTAIIKRHMANLLYPVDLSSFSTPDNDRKFSELITLLQKQMGVPETGILTSGQFSRLSDASRDIDGRQILLSPGKIVSMNGDLLLAVGTGAMDDIANPLNKVRIVCVKSEGTCNMTEASVNNRTLDLYNVASYEIQTWTQNRITAIREHACGTAMMSVDVSAKTVAVVVTPHNDLKFCSDKPSGTWSLVDGFSVAWNVARDRQMKALELVYEPSRKLIRILEPIKPTPSK
jgi:hypothetical protein